ncbi:glycosyltransferase family 2 protein [Larkinella insperata]|uniref:Glycosyltransferase family 2 protein n=1 Tax=Larkinella insperata TaxID=332158 RepID=A0ABW3Q695_9BACT|nr:glycosyltransferase family 2 protein [Larkinella insperata]
MITRVIILNYNTADLTLQCVDYIRQQEDELTHIVVVDNGSTKEHCQILEESLPCSVKLIKIHNNIGFSAGNNRGCGKIGGLPDADYYLFINSDAFLTQANSIQELRNELAKESKAVAISPLIHTVSNSTPVRLQIQVRRVIAPGWLIVCQSPILRRLPFFKQRYLRFIYNDLVPYQEKVYRTDSINGAVFMVKAEFMHRINLLDEGTFLYLEELILGEQVQRLNKVCLLHGGVIVPHLQGASSGSKQGENAKKSFYFFIDSEAYLLRKYHNFSEWALSVIRRIRLFEFAIKSLLYRFK